MDVIWHPQAEEELAGLPLKERVAVVHAVEKLSVLGMGLRYPHCSHVQGAGDLWELRPRQGRCPWRAFYRRIGDAFVIGAIGPEAKVDAGRFLRATTAAEARLDDVIP